MYSRASLADDGRRLGLLRDPTPRDGWALTCLGGFASSFAENLRKIAGSALKSWLFTSTVMRSLGGYLPSRPRPLELVAVEI